MIIFVYIWKCIFHVCSFWRILLHWMTVLVQQSSQTISSKNGLLSDERRGPSLSSQYDRPQCSRTWIPRFLDIQTTWWGHIWPQKSYPKHPKKTLCQMVFVWISNGEYGEIRNGTEFLPIRGLSNWWCYFSFGVFEFFFLKYLWIRLFFLWHPDFVAVVSCFGSIVRPKLGMTFSLPKVPGWSSGKTHVLPSQEAATCACHGVFVCTLWITPILWPPWNHP